MGKSVIPCLERRRMLETEHSACGFQREAKVAVRCCWSVTAEQEPSGEAFCIFRPSYCIKFFAKGNLDTSPGRGAQDTGWGWILNPDEKAKKTISIFLITLALAVTCGQGGQVITHCVFYQIKQINLMGLSHILDFPINGCDLPT